MSQEYIPATGLLPDPLDKRDFRYRDMLAGGAPKIDWEKGFRSHEALGLPLPTADQGVALRCVGEGWAMRLRRAWKAKTGQDVRFSAKAIYSQIFIAPSGGAYIRDGGLLAVKAGVQTEEDVPSYMSGVSPSEAFSRDLSWRTPEMIAKAKKFDDFNCRMLEGDTDDMDLFAHAIQEQHGIVAGFTGTNPGWCSCPVCQIPKAGDGKWNHCIDIPDFGLTDVEECGIPVGTKALFFPNSWGGRYTFKTGRWKGNQAITADYFQAGEQTAAGFVKGIYVSHAWVLVANDVTPDNVKIMDFIKKNEGRIVQLTEAGVPGSGSMALILDGRFLVISPARSGQAALTAYGRKMQQTIVEVDKKTWDALPKQDF